MLDIEKQVKQAIEKYNLLDKRDNVVVALSGGKDSTSLLYILHKLGYNVQGLMIDLDLGEWSKTHKKNMEEFCKDLGVKLTVVDLKKELGHGICFIKSVVKKNKNLSGCTVCGITKRWILNKWAKKLKTDKIATGHNLDDEAQTVLMDFLKGNLMLGVNSSPATGGGLELNGFSKEKDNSSKDSMDNQLINGKDNIRTKCNLSRAEGEALKGFVQRIKPMFFVPENEIREYAKKMNFPILYDRCPCAIGTYRVETRAWIKDISDKEKLKIVENWQKVIPKLKKEQNGRIFECKICGEPARNEICNACKIFESVKG